MDLALGRGKADPAFPTLALVWVVFAPDAAILGLVTRVFFFGETLLLAFLVVAAVLLPFSANRLLLR